MDAVQVRLNDKYHVYARIFIYICRYRILYAIYIFDAAALHLLR